MSALAPLLGAKRTLPPALALCVCRQRFASGNDVRLAGPNDGNWFAPGDDPCHGGVCLTGGQIIMFGTESWGYGGYGQIHMIIWIVIAAAAAAGFMWRLTR